MGGELHAGEDESDGGMAQGCQPAGICLAKIEQYTYGTVLTVSATSDFLRARGYVNLDNACVTYI